MKNSSYFRIAEENPGVMAVVDSISTAVAKGINDNRFGGLRFSDVGASGVQVSLCGPDGKTINDFNGSYEVTIRYSAFGIQTPCKKDSERARCLEDGIEYLIQAWPRKNLEYAVSDGEQLLSELHAYGCD